VLLSTYGSSHQATLDSFFAPVCDSPMPDRAISDRAVAKARKRLHPPALTWISGRLLQRADATDLRPKSLALRVIAGDGSALVTAMQACSCTHRSASADPRSSEMYLGNLERGCPEARIRRLKTEAEVVDLKQSTLSPLFRNGAANAERHVGPTLRQMVAKHGPKRCRALLSRTARNTRPLPAEAQFTLEDRSKLWKIK